MPRQFEFAEIAPLPPAGRIMPEKGTFSLHESLHILR